MKRITLVDLASDTVLSFSKVVEHFLDFAKSKSGKEAEKKACVQAYVFLCLYYQLFHRKKNVDSPWQSLVPTMLSVTPQYIGVLEWAVGLPYLFEQYRDSQNLVEILPEYGEEEALIDLAEAGYVKRHGMGVEIDEQRMSETMEAVLV